MKDIPYFYDKLMLGCLLIDEALHATRVLRLKSGDEIRVIDGKGNLHHATITNIDKHGCRYRIDRTETIEPLWQGHLHIAVAPTKNADRMEWFVEKAVEIGIDELTFLHCKHSERTSMNDDRIGKLTIAAMKQSQKTRLPRLNGMVDFNQFIRQEHVDCRFICHCRQEMAGEDNSAKPYLLDAMRRGGDTTVLIGPEGDFSEDEVRAALCLGFKSVSLGNSRLRTETAAMVAVTLMQANNRL